MTPQRDTDGGGEAPAIVPWAVGGALTLGVVALILVRPGIEAVWDQTWIAYQFSDGYPHFETGIVSSLIVGAVNTAIPYDGVATNTVMRALAALLYMTAAGLLAWSASGGPAVRRGAAVTSSGAEAGTTGGDGSGTARRVGAFALFLLLVVTARFPFLWLSSELLAGAFMMLFLWSLVRRHPFMLTGIFLVLFGLSKADLALPALLIGAFLVVGRDHAGRWKRAALLAGLVALLVVPSLSTPSYYARFGGRTWVSFVQHYGGLVERHQLGERLPGFRNGLQYVRQSFPEATTVPEAALKHPRVYLDFVTLSATESAVRALKTKVLLLLPLAILLFTRLGREPRITVLLILSSLVPIVMLAFLHMRYQARFYPLALFVIFAGLAAGRPEDARGDRWIMVALGALLLWQTFELIPVLETAYWLPD